MSNVSDYRKFLSEADIEDCEEDPTELRSMVKMRKREVDRKMKNFMLGNSRGNVSTPTHKGELRIVMLGKTGQGKSATANTLLGLTAKSGGFFDNCTSVSVTTTSSCLNNKPKSNQRLIRVVDTPGLQDTRVDKRAIMEEVANFATLFPHGVHAFVYLMNMANPRFTKEDMDVLDTLEKNFGGHFKKYCLLVYSYGNSKLESMTLDDFIAKQKQVGGFPDQKREVDTRLLSKFLRDLEWRIVAVDNKTKTKYEGELHRSNLLDMIDKMRSINRPPVYTNEIFKQAQKDKEARRVECLKQGWTGEEVDVVECILNENDEIGRDELEKKVRERLFEHQRKEIEKKYDMKMEDLRRQHESKMGEFREDFDSKISNMQQEHADSLMEVTDKHDETISGIRQTYGDKMDHFSSRMQSMEDERVAEIEEIKREADARAEQLNEQVNNIKKERDEAKKNIVEKILETIGGAVIGAVEWVVG